MVGRLSVIAIAGAAAVGLTFAVAAPASTDATRLVGRTGPGFTITLKRAGKDVEWLRRGTYTIKIRDTSRSHEFVLFRWRNPPERRPWKILTSFAFVGTKTVTITLRPGTYTYTCGRHAAQGMHESFVVA
jgi:plastocyanin